MTVSLHTTQKNRKLGLWLGAGVVFMVGLSFAAVPLYDLFCKAVGINQKAEAAKAIPQKILNREVTVRFNTDVAPGLPWAFKADHVSMKVKIGEVHKLLYRVTNQSKDPGLGISVYSIQPERAGLYFHKVHCFCFEDMMLKAGETNSPYVQFFVDPAFADDHELKDVDTITLSYTFFSSKSPKLTEARKKFEDEQNRLLELSKTN